MRIAIDARMMGPTSTRGIGRYVEELIRHMLEIAPEHTFVLVTRQKDHPFVHHPSVETHVVDIVWYGLQEQLRMSRVMRSLRADVVHFPHWNVPLNFSQSYVLTVHDLLLRHFPASAKASTRGPIVRAIKQLGYRLVLSHAISRAARILVPTQTVADDVAQLYPRSRSRLIVTGEGMPSSPLDEGAALDRQSPYLLYVGAAYPHKGLDDVLAAWPSVSREFPELRLRIVGEQDVFMRRAMDLAKTSNAPRVEFLGSVSDENLQKLYCNATAFVFPTHFEGFGLPPLEAIAHGTPVLCSDIPVMREVLGDDGAIFFRPGSPNDILLAVQRLMREPEHVRQQTREQAVELARRHQWKNAAQHTLNAYRSVC